MFAQLRDQIEIVIVISAEDIVKNKVRADLGITYDEDVLRLREAFTDRVVLWWAAWSLPIITASALPTISANVLPAPV